MAKLSEDAEQARIAALEDLEAVEGILLDLAGMTKSLDARDAHQSVEDAIQYLHDMIEDDD